MKKSDFDKLLERYLNGTINEDERKKLDAWLDIMKGEDTKDLRFSKEDENRLFGKISSNIDSMEEIISFRPGPLPSQSQPKTIYYWALAASVMILAVSAVLFLVNPFSTQVEFEHIASKPIEKIILKDGTLVWLQSNSKISFQQESNPSIRNVELQGDGLFEVTKDPANPFQIHCGDVTITVTGTSFNLRSSRDSVEVIVLTGNVSVYSKNQQSTAKVFHNEKLTYKNGQFQKSAMSSEERGEITTGTNYNMEFVNTELDTIIQRLQDKFNVIIKVQNENLKNCSITADFTDHSLHNSLQMISEVLNLNFTEDSNVIILSGDGCNNTNQ